MPHLILEHSADLEKGYNLQELCDRLWSMLAGQPSVKDVTSLRVRTIAATASRIGAVDQSFVHATLLLLPGRTEEVRFELAQKILDTLKRDLPNVTSLSVRLDDLKPPYLKRML